MVLTVSPAMAEQDLFHVRTSLAKNDAQICVVPTPPWPRLPQGNEVIALFDAGAVIFITRGWCWFNGGKTTPMDNATAPQQECKSMARQCDVPLEDVPSNYGTYMNLLKKRGVTMYVNRTMLTPYKIDPKDVDPVVEPIDVRPMYRLFNTADRTLVY